MRIDFIYDEGSSKEDAYLINDNIFGVFDGANSLDRFIDKDGRKGGLIAASIARNEFSKNDKSLKDSAVEANRKIRKRMLDLKIDIKKKINLWLTTAAVVRIKDNLFEWLQIGDSLILVLYKDNSWKLLVKDYDHDKEVLTTWKELAKQKKENIREIIDRGPHIELRNQANKKYGVLNGEKEAISFIKTGKRDLKNVKHILLFTDGLIIPKEDPSKDDDFGTWVKLFLNGGLQKVRDFIRNLQKEDPKCWKYPRWKQYDDITAVCLSF